jgi:uncharacterized protein
LGLSLSLALLITMLPTLDSLAKNWVSASPLLKILAFFAAWLILWIPIVIPLGRRFHWRPFAPLPPAQKLSLVLSLYAIVPLLIWGLTHLEIKSLSMYGIAWNGTTLGSLMAGLGLGVAGVGGLFGLEWRLGWVEGQPLKTPSIVLTFGLPLGLGLGIGAIEELVFRGFLLTQLQQQQPHWLAAAISSLVFALLHLIWDGKQARPQLLGLGLMGLVLVLARQINGGNLGLAWGLHAGWIWAMTSLNTAQLFHDRDSAPQWMTGAGQPLAGAMGFLMLGVTGGILWGWSWVGN